MFRRHIVFICTAWLAAVCGVLFYAAAHAGGDHNANATRDLKPQIRAAAHALSNITPPAVVFVGELHNQFPYHLNQLVVISALRERGLNVAIGMEMFQTPFQQPLDDYISGHIDFVTMLERTEYFTRWRYDVRLYQPIFTYAQQHGLPLVALNAPRELTDRVSTVGIAGLDPQERTALPAELISIDPEHRARLEEAFEEHAGSDDMNFERFVEVQRTWDEVMGQRSAEFIHDNPDHVLVVLAGVQHVAHGYGIPIRVEKDTGLRGTIILTENERKRVADGADVFLDLTDERLPDSGRMGVFIKDSDSGAAISGFAENSPAQNAGAEKDDVIEEVNGRPVKRFEDVKLALWDKLPGDPVLLKVRRNGGERVQMAFELY